MNFLGTTEKQRKAGELGLIFLIQSAVLTLLMVLVNTQFGEKIPVAIRLVSSEAIVVIPAIIYTVIKKTGFSDGLGFKKVKVSTVIKAILLSFLVLPITAFVNVLTQFLVPNTMTQAQDALTGAMNAGILLLYVGVIAPVCEEICFRGVFANGFKGITTLLNAALVSAMMFGLFHMNLNQTAYAFVLGFIFVIVNVASGSIWTSVIMHVAINTTNQLMLVGVTRANEAVGSDQSVAELAEVVRQNKMVLLVYVIIYGILAIGAFFLVRLCIKSIAKKEGNEEILAGMFKKKSEEAESSDASEEEKVRIVLNIPMILGILVCIGVIISDFIGK